MNKQARIIKDLCNGQNTVDDIIKVLSDRYEKIGKDRLTNDLFTVIHNFWRLGFIKWGASNPFDNFYEEVIGDYTFKVYLEDKVLETIDCILNKSLINANIPKEIQYSPSILNQSVFSGMESFYCIEQNKIANLIISLLNIPDARTSSTMGLVFVNNPNNLLPSIISEFLSWACNKYYSLYRRKKITRIDFCIFQSDLNNESFNLLKKVGFEQAGVLKYGFGWDSQSDIYLFSYDLIS